MLKSLDGTAMRRWAATCCDELAAHRDEIDGLNVFPVADQDTGSNLLATMRAGLDAVLRAEQEDEPIAGTAVAGTAVAGTAAALARGTLTGARGNSGVILSQVLRGLAESLADVRELDGAALRTGLRRAGELATAAVSEPAPGTVLTVLHAAAQAAAAIRSDDLCEVATAAAAAAACALADTPRQLAVLARAGVVDAGGQGLVLLLEALLAVITERSGPRAMAVAAPARPAQTLQAQREGGSAEYGYEVMYLLDETDDARVTALRAELCGLGDCVAIVGSGPEQGAAALWNVHVHCSDVGAAIEAGVRAGRPHRITVLRFFDQTHADRTHPDQAHPAQTHPDQDRAGEPGRFVTGQAVLVMVSGAGVAELLRGEGAVTVAATCSVTELLAVLAGTRARHATVLAGRGAAAQVAEAAAAQARDTGQEVVVVPTASPVQALAAFAVHDAQRRAADDTVAMTEAAAVTRRGELTTATQEALTWAGRCRPGDLLGMVDDEVVLIEHDLAAAARGLVDRMLATGGELVTVLLGQQAPAEVAEVLGEHLRNRYPEVEAVLYQGGQPDSVLLLGVE
ncbi:MAG: DAK2 domain-containing protein [Pseudonocardiaceae bacterium]